MRHSLREKSVIISNAGTRGHADTSCDTCCDMADDGAVKIRSNHDIELGRVFDQLHGTVINNHFFVFDEGEFFRSLTSTVQEESVYQFHDVGLVNHRHFLATTQMGKLKGILQETL